MRANALITSLLLSLFAMPALAQGGDAGGIASLLPLVFLLIIFYFLLIRPQMKRQKEHRALVGGLGKGDEIVTDGGLMGKVRGLDEKYMSLEIAEGVHVPMSRQAVQAVLPKGTLKEISKD